MKRADFERLEARRKRWRDLLQVVGVVAVAVFLFGYCGHRNQPEPLIRHHGEESNEVVNLVRAVKAYEMEYSRLPIPNGVAATDSYETETDERFVDILTSHGSDGGASSRGPLFYKGKLARDGKGGLLVVNPKLGPRLVDGWGRPYIVVIDANDDGAVVGPDGTRIAQDVICYSLGEDGVFDAKDPKSW